MNWIKRIFGKKVKEKQCAIDSVSKSCNNCKHLIPYYACGDNHMKPMCLNPKIDYNINVYIKEPSKMYCEGYEKSNFC